MYFSVNSLLNHSYVKYYIQLIYTEMLLMIYRWGPLSLNVALAFEKKNNEKKNLT